MKQLFFTAEYYYFYFYFRDEKVFTAKNNSQQISLKEVSKGFAVNIHSETFFCIIKRRIPNDSSIKTKRATSADR